MTSGAGGQNDRASNQVDRSTLEDPSPDEWERVQKERQGKGRRQLAIEVNGLRDRRRSGKQQRGVGCRLLVDPQPAEAVDADRQRQQGRKLHDDEGQLQTPGQFRQGSDRHVRARGIRDGGETGVPALIPRREPIAGVVVAKEDVDVGVVGSPVRPEHQESAVEEEHDHQRPTDPAREKHRSPLCKRARRG